MARPEFDRELAIRVLGIAELSGDEVAAKGARVTVRTLRRWRSRLESDPELSARKREITEDQARDVDETFRGFLVRAVLKLDSLVGKTDSPEHIRSIADAVRTVGDLMTTRAGLGVSREPPAPAPAAPPPHGRRADHDPEGPGAAEAPEGPREVQPRRGLRVA
jgi:hypothetical protein